MATITIPDAVQNCGDPAVLIFRTLLTHEYMSKEKIVEKSGIAPTTASSYLTALRRSGWIEARGNRVNRQWKRREHYSVPQEDFYHRTTKAQRKAESEEGDALHHLTEAGRHLNEAMRLIGPLIELSNAAKKALGK